MVAGNLDGVPVSEYRYAPIQELSPLESRWVKHVGHTAIATRAVIENTYPVILVTGDLILYVTTT